PPVYQFDQTHGDGRADEVVRTVADETLWPRLFDRPFHEERLDHFRRRTLHETIAKHRGRDGDALLWPRELAQRATERLVGETGCLNRQDLGGSVHQHLAHGSCAV